MPHTESGQQPLGFLVKQAELCPLNILSSLVTPPQLIIGVVPVVMLDISVLSQQLVCCGLLEPLASEGNYLARLHVFRHLQRISLSQLISLGSSYSQWRETGVAGYDLSDML